MPTASSLAWPATPGCPCCNCLACRATISAPRRSTTSPICSPPRFPSRKAQRRFLHALLCLCALLTFHEALEALAARRVAQFAQRLGLDLADTLARDLEVLPHLFQGVIRLLADAEAHAQDFLL